MRTETVQFHYYSAFFWSAVHHILVLYHYFCIEIIIYYNLVEPTKVTTHYGTLKKFQKWQKSSKNEGKPGSTCIQPMSCALISGCKNLISLSEIGSITSPGEDADRVTGTCSDFLEMMFDLACTLTSGASLDFLEKLHTDRRAHDYISWKCCLTRHAE